MAAVDPIVIASAAASLPKPPTAWGWVGTDWAGLRPEFDLEVWADLASDVTDAELLGAALEAVTLVDDDVDAVNAGANTIQLTGHAYLTGDGPVVPSVVGGTIVGGLTAGEGVYLRKVDANNVKVYTTREAAMTDGTPIDITGAGTGTTTFADVPGSTERIHWFSYGLLGPAFDGVLALTAQMAFTVRALHRPRTLAYALSGTPSAALSASIRLVRPASAG